MRHFKLWRKNWRTNEERKAASEVEERIWAYVQDHNGEMAINRYDITFRIDDKYGTILALMFPFLVVVTPKD